MQVYEFHDLYLWIKIVLPYSRGNPPLYMNSLTPSIWLISTLILIKNITVLANPPALEINFSQPERQWVDSQNKGPSTYQLMPFSDIFFYPPSPDDPNFGLKLVVNDRSMTLFILSSPLSRASIDMWTVPTEMCIAGSPSRSVRPYWLTARLECIHMRYRGLSSHCYKFAQVRPIQRSDLVNWNRLLYIYIYNCQQMPARDVFE